MSQKLHYIFQDVTQDAFFYKLSVSNFDFSKEDLNSLGIDHFDNYIKDGLSAFFDIEHEFLQIMTCGRATFLGSLILQLVQGFMDRLSPLTPAYQQS